MLICRGQYQLKLCECWFINSRDTIVIKCYLRIINHSEIGVMFTSATRFRLGASLCDTLSKKEKNLTQKTHWIYIYIYHWKFMLDSWLIIESSFLALSGSKHTKNDGNSASCHGLTQLRHCFSRGKTHLPMPIQQALAAS